MLHTVFFLRNLSMLNNVLVEIQNKADFMKQKQKLTKQGKHNCLYQILVFLLCTACIILMVAVRSIYFGCDQPLYCWY